MSACPNEEIAAKFSALTKDGANYKRDVYALYVKAYYPDLSAYERTGDVPLLRSYYYRNYLNSYDTKKSLFLFEDVLFGYFTTDSGVELNFYGSFAD